MSLLIDRQAAIDAVERNACNTQRAIDAINALPSAQPERKPGEWVPKEALNVPYGIILECSECGFETLVNDALYFKFCPNCGADMRKDGKRHG